MSGPTGVRVTARGTRDFSRWRAKVCPSCSQQSITAHGWSLRSVAFSSACPASVRGFAGAFLHAAGSGPSSVHSVSHDPAEHGRWATQVDEQLLANMGLDAELLGRLLCDCLRWTHRDRSREYRLNGAPIIVITRGGGHEAS